LSVAEAEARGQFGNTDEGEYQPLEAVTRRLIQTQQTEKTQFCALVSRRETASVI
jgi:hypothetical protein